MKEKYYRVVSKRYYETFVSAKNKKEAIEKAINEGDWDLINFDCLNDVRESIVDVEIEEGEEEV